MTKKVSGLWLIVLVAAALGAGIVFWMYSGRAAANYDGGILVEIPAKTAAAALRTAPRSGAWAERAGRVFASGIGR